MKTKIPNSFRGAIDYLSVLYEIDLGLFPATHICLAEGVVYISTKTLADMLKVSYHATSVDYVKPLIAAGVKRMALGNRKFYCLEDIVSLIKRSIKEQTNILSVCKNTNINGKPKRKKRS